MRGTRSICIGPSRLGVSFLRITARGQSGSETRGVCLAGYPSLLGHSTILVGYSEGSDGLRPGGIGSSGSWGSLTLDLQRGEQGIFLVAQCQHDFVQAVNEVSERGLRTQGRVLL